MEYWGSTRRTIWLDHRHLPADFQAIKDRLDSFTFKHEPAQVEHAPHQRANDVCNQDECIGYGSPKHVDDYGTRIFGRTK